VPDLLILMVAGTICLVLLGATGAVLTAEFVNPQADTRRLVDFLLSTMSVMLGTVAGFLAGRHR
jgi:hypothetical protein